MAENNVLEKGETPHDFRIKILPEELELINRINPKKVLEVCSGDGQNLSFFSKKGIKIIGLESNEHLISKAINLGESHNLDFEVLKHSIFLDKFPFSNDSFDFIYSYQYINHNFKDQIEEVFKEIYRVLKSGGHFSIKVPDITQFNTKHLNGNIYVENDEEFSKIRYRKLADQTFAKLELDEIWIPHYGFKKEELIESLEEVGFELINIRQIKWNWVGNFKKNL